MNKKHIISSIDAGGGDIQLGPLSLQAIVIEVPQAQSASAFFTALGLLPREDGAGWCVEDDAQACIIVMDGPRKRLRRLVFACRADQIALLGYRGTQAGSTLVEASGEGLILRGPDAIEVEFVPCRDRWERGPGAGELLLARSPSRRDAPAAKPIALSHVAIFVSDVDDALAFYTDVVGLRLSDRCGSELAFLHSPHGSGHHVLALVRSAGPGLHHYSFEMGTVDAIGLRAAHMAEHGFDRGWGMGRHVLGSNIFHYVRDPWGSHAELTAGLEYIAADAKRVAGDHATDDAFYLWGPPPSPGFIDNPEMPPGWPDDRSLKARANRKGTTDGNCI